MAKRRLILVVRGGLGNQLFQYASSRALSLRLGAELVLDAYTGFENDIFGQKYELDNFRIAAKALDPHEAAWAKRRYSAQRSVRWRVEQLYFRCFNTYYIPSLFDCMSSGALCADVYVMEYLQSYRYFQHIAPQLREELTLVRELRPEERRLADAILTGSSASVHVRSPHALAADGHLVCPQYFGTELDGSYYRTAVDRVTQHSPGVRFFLFSDDPHAGDRLTAAFGSKSDAVDAGMNDACVDLFLMSLCQHNIIANSTFGWWAAWLNRWPDKTVYAPARWYTGPRPREFYPPDWLVL